MLLAGVRGVAAALTGVISTFTRVRVSVLFACLSLVGRVVNPRDRVHHRPSQVGTASDCRDTAGDAADEEEAYHGRCARPDEAELKNSHPYASAMCRCLECREQLLTPGSLWAARRQPAGVFLEGGGDAKIRPDLVRPSLPGQRSLDIAAGRELSQAFSEPVTNLPIHLIRFIRCAGPNYSFWRKLHCGVDKNSRNLATARSCSE